MKLSPKNDDNLIRGGFMAVHSADKYMEAYPTTYRLPGNITPIAGSRAFESPLRGAIAAHLCYYGMPHNIDVRLSRMEQQVLPHREDNDSIRNLSLFTYTLKQMTGARVITPDQAWDYFSSPHLPEGWFSIGTLTQTKQTILTQLFNSHDVNSAFQSDLSDMNMTGHSTDKLLFEFWARSGRAGLLFFDGYSDWVNKSSVKAMTGGTMLDEETVQEFKQAFWIEMRLCEYAFGMKINEDQKDFAVGGLNTRLLGGGVYTDINLSEGLDIPIKAELGHWMFERSLPYWKKGNYELTDRANILGFYPSIVDFLKIFSRTRSTANMPPFVRVFIEGGFFASNLETRYQFQEEWKFPLYPYAYPGLINHFERSSMFEPHEEAEFLEHKIRTYAVDLLTSEKISPRETYQLYRQLLLSEMRTSFESKYVPEGNGYDFTLPSAEVAAENERATVKEHATHVIDNSN